MNNYIFIEANLGPIQVVNSRLKGWPVHQPKRWKIQER